MVPQLFNTPKNDHEWNLFSFANKASHTKIVQAISQKKLGTLREYNLDPINKEDVAGWAYRHQQAHNEFNAALKLQSNDLYTADFSDPKQLSAWIAIHAREHLLAEKALA